MIGSQNEYNGKIFYVKAVTKEEDAQCEPYFAFKQKVDGEYKVVQKDKGFSGALEKVETYEREWKGVKSTNVKVTVVDNDEKYVWDAPFSILSRSVFNTLLGLESYENLKFTIYLTKPNAAKAGARYPQISVWQNDQLVKWKYELSELPAIKKVRVKGQDMSDTEDIDNFFIKALNEKFSGSIKASAPAKKAESPAPAPKKTTKGKPQPTEDDSDPYSEIPF
jgi:hypothetical protein